ncbi:MAG TPA: 4'-phosphopantetheinyl transferase superfamily protein [Gammaproteobacteria bacterium]|nr:4'-phosphopantetheinyl transferase superfamily protein [Gammaproteobacteria bacterium]
MNIEPVQWQAAPKNLFLKDGEVHVWLIHSFVENSLDQEEQGRAAKFISLVHQERFIKAHSGLREILSKYTHQNPKSIIFDKTASGKPILKHFPNIHFNLSHSEDIALCAVSNNPVGIDVEYLNKNMDYLSIAKRFFNPVEYEFIKSQENFKLAFFKLWTQKEAYLKSQGKGIAGGLEVEIPKEVAITHFVPAPHYLAAVGSGEQLIFFHSSGF